MATVRKVKQPEQRSPRLRIFVSHSSDDYHLVNALVDALHSSFEVPDKAILCSSLAGHRLTNGSHFGEELRAKMLETTVLIAVVTPSSLESAWVSYEVGAGWVANKQIMPLLAGVGTGELQGVFAQINATDATGRSEVEEFFSDIATATGWRQRTSNSSAINAIVTLAQSYYDEEEEDEDE